MAKFDWRDIATVAVAAFTSAAAFLIAAVWHEGNAALCLAFLAGLVLGFARPARAWLSAVILIAWLAIVFALKVPLAAFASQDACAQANGPHGSALWLLIVPCIAVGGGVAVDWIISRVLAFAQRLGFWPSVLALVKPVLRCIAVVSAAALLLAVSLQLAQPLQPRALNEPHCWDEFCFSVTSVRRTQALGTGAAAIKARGVFYVVTANMETPWWGRFPWSDDAVFVTDYEGMNYRASRAGERALGPEAARRALCHLIPGAAETETLVFDLPPDVMQPRLLVRDTLGFNGFLGGVRASLIYTKPAFNLRYD